MGTIWLFRIPIFNTVKIIYVLYYYFLISVVVNVDNGVDMFTRHYM